METFDVVVEEERNGSDIESLCVEGAPCLTWQHLTVTTKGSQREKSVKQLLNSVCGTIQGGLWAILGPSGSGKTTFLSTLALRLDTYRMSQSGLLMLNGRKYTKRILKSCSGYVMQDDLLIPHLTVTETLRYAAELRMPQASARAEREEREAQVMELVGITHCANTLVGDTRVKGISGGERKRLCVAIELLTKPRLLFLDEPTSGLDSATAFSLVRLLKAISADTKAPTTVITTIHQPQAKIFQQFDNLILMRKGEMVYQGNASLAMKYFETIGFPCPQYSNPADHMLDVLTGSELLLEAEAEAEAEAVGLKKSVVGNGGESREDLLSAEMTASQSPDHRHLYSLGSSSASFPAFNARVDTMAGSDQPEIQPYVFPSWQHQFKVLFRRSMYLHLRRYDIILINVFVTMLVSTFVSMSTWRSLGASNSSTSRRLPALFYCTIHQGIISSLQGTHSFPLDRAIMLRERSAGTYTVSAYFSAKSTADFVVQVISPIIFSCMVYPIVGFSSGASKFFTFMAFMILTSQAATSISNMISCLCVSIELSTIVLACVYEISRLYGGWFIKPADMLLYSQWRFADALSYIKYSFVGISLNENDGLLINCDPSLPKSTCAAPCVVGTTCTGNAINSFYGYSDYSISLCAGILLVFIFGCKLFSYLGLRFIKM
jgi:ATP-binding cassette subfamily G (WHITE) protein 2